MPTILWVIHLVDFVFLSSLSCCTPTHIACRWAADREVQVQWSRKPTWRKVLLWCKVECSVSNFRASCFRNTHNKNCMAVSGNWIKGPWLEQPVLWSWPLSYGYQPSISQHVNEEIFLVIISLIEFVAHKTDWLPGMRLKHSVPLVDCGPNQELQEQFPWPVALFSTLILAFCPISCTLVWSP